MNVALYLRKKGTDARKNIVISNSLAGQIDLTKHFAHIATYIYEHLHLEFSRIVMEKKPYFK